MIALSRRGQVRPGHASAVFHQVSQELPPQPHLRQTHVQRKRQLAQKGAKTSSRRMSAFSRQEQVQPGHVSAVLPLYHSEQARLPLKRLRHQTRTYVQLKRQRVPRCAAISSTRMNALLRQVQVRHGHASAVLHPRFQLQPKTPVQIKRQLAPRCATISSRRTSALLRQGQAPPGHANAALRRPLGHQAKLHQTKPRSCQGQSLRKTFVLPRKQLVQRSVKVSWMSIIAASHLGQERLGRASAALRRLLILVRRKKRLVESCARVLSKISCAAQRMEALLILVNVASAVQQRKNSCLVSRD